jgi:hypothetical protein
MNDTCPRLDQQASPHLDGTVEQAWRSRGTKSSLARDEHTMYCLLRTLSQYPQNNNLHYVHSLSLVLQPGMPKEGQK